MSSEHRHPTIVNTGFLYDEPITPSDEQERNPLRISDIELTGLEIHHIHNDSPEDGLVRSEQQRCSPSLHRHQLHPFKD